MVQCTPTALHHAGEAPFFVVGLLYPVLHRQILEYNSKRVLAQWTSPLPQGVQYTQSGLTFVLNATCATDPGQSVDHNSSAVRRVRYIVD